MNIQGKKEDGQHELKIQQIVFLFLFNQPLHFQRKKSHRHLCQCGFLQRIPVLLHGDPDRSLLTPFRPVAGCRLGRAHVIEEQYADAAPKPALYRPKSNYIGD